MVVAVTNLVPVLGKDSVSLDEDTFVVINVLGNDIDTDGGVLTVTAVSGLLHGTAVINADNTITYTPNADYNGSESFLYTVSDGQGGLSNQRVNVTINPVADVVEPNAAPVLGKDNVTLDEDTSVVINVLGNDSDANGDTLTITSVAGAIHGTAVINADNTITYTPNADYNGSESFLYTVSDGNGGVATQRVNVTVNPVDEVVVPNVAPVLKKDSATVNEDNSVVIHVLGNDTDANGDTLTVTAVSGLQHGTAVINADNTITYTPNADYNGSESFLYTVNDGHGGIATQRVNITVNAVADEVEPNVAPVLGKDNVTGNEDTVIAINVLGNDSDTNGDTLTVTSVSGLHHGTAVINADNTISYTPTHDYFGVESFTYTVSDGNGGVATQRVNVTILDTPEVNVINGTEDGETINGTTGDDVINGLGGMDTIYGGIGNDVINGGAGKDMLDGGAGADIFVIDTLDADPLVWDIIIDYNPLSEGDKIDISALLIGYDPVTSAISDFVSASSGEFVNVDRDGAGTNYDWQTVVQPHDSAVAVDGNIILYHPPVDTIA